MDPGQLMNTVSFVLQNSHLIKASILDNVRLGRMWNEYQQSVAWNVAKEA